MNGFPIRFSLVACCFVFASFARAEQGPTSDAAPLPPAAAAAASPPATVDAGSCCGPVCQPRMIEQTCYVPTPTHETRTVQCVEYRTEQRQQTVTVMHV